MIFSSPQLRAVAIAVAALGVALPLFSGMARRASCRTTFVSIIVPGLLLAFAANLITGDALSRFSILYLIMVLAAYALCGSRAGIAAAVITLVLEGLSLAIGWSGARGLLGVAYVHAVSLIVIIGMGTYLAARERFSQRRLQAVNDLAFDMHREDTPQHVLEALVEGAGRVTGSLGAALFATGGEGVPRLLAQAGQWTPGSSADAHYLNLVDQSGGSFRLEFIRPRDLDALWPEIEGHFSLALQHAQGKDRADRELAQVYDELRDSSLRLSELYLETIEALVTMLETRDRHTAGHSRRVASYAMLLGRKLGMSPDQLDALRQAAVVHDIGKIALGDGILLKPGPLTDEEWTQMRRHPEAGVEILERVPGLADLIPAVRWHHERWDGKGYPDGLRELEIPLAARVLAVVDAFDAITSVRSYRDARSADQAIAILRDGVGSQWCTQCAGTFVALLESGEIDPKTIPEADVRLSIPALP